MSNPEAVAALKELANEEFALVKTDLKLGSVEVWVRAMHFRQQMKLRRQFPGDDEDVSQVRVLIRCLFDSAGELLLDPLDDDHMAWLSNQKRGSFWIGVSNAITESGEPGKASTQTKSS